MDLLEQLLSRPQTGEHDRNLVFRVIRQPDEIARQVDNLDRLAHVQHEHAPAVSKRRCLQDE